MRTSFGALSVIITVVVFVACGDSGTNDPGGEFSTVSQQPAITGLYGKVVDTNGIPVAGAVVMAGSVSVAAGDDGGYELSVAAGGPTMVDVSAQGYLKAFRQVDIQTGKGTAANFTMKKTGQALQFDSSAGGTVTGTSNAAITAPGGAFVDSAGNPVSGTIDVYLTPLDPSLSMDLLAYPGDLVAEETDGGTVLLETYGVLEVTAMAGQEELQVADGKVLSISIPAPSGVTSPPATMPLWYFDEQEGIWKEEGTATYNAALHVYEGEIEHLSYWNADVGTDAACLSGQVVDGSGDPVVGASVRAAGVSYMGSASATTDASGKFCVAVQPNSTVLLTVSDGFGHVAQRQVTSGTDTVVIPLDCATATCTDVGNIDMAVDGASCSDFLNIFADSCVADLASLSECLDMAGGCQIEYQDNGGEIVIRYENGARIVTEVVTGSLTGGGYTADTTYYNSKDQVCGTAHTAGVTDGEQDYSVNLTDPEGREWQITYHQDGGVTYVCPGGEQVVVSSAQNEAISACLVYSRASQARRGSGRGPPTDSHLHFSL